MISRNLRAVSISRGALPLMHARMLVRSYLGVSGWLLMALYSVGTAGKRVARVCCTALRVMGRSRGLGIRTMVAPIRTLRFMATVMPYTWKNGMDARVVSCPSRRSVIQQRACSQLDTRFPCVSMAPLGTPVVPPVYWSSATSSAFRVTGCGVGVCDAMTLGMDSTRSPNGMFTQVPSRLAFKGYSRFLGKLRASCTPVTSTRLTFTRPWISA